MSKELRNEVEVRPVTDFQGYQVTSDGRVLGLKGQELKAWEINSGYLSVVLHGKPQLVHRLVAREFCEGYSPELQVNHKDADRHNNHKDNLEWVTLRENLADARRRNGDTSHIARAQLAKVSKKRVNMLTLDGEFIKEYTSPTDLCKEMGWIEGRRAKISEVAHGKRPQAFGYKFEWADPEQANRSVSKKNRK